MKITGRIETETVTDVRCDVCGCSARLESGNLEYGMLHAHWGYGALHDGERYERTSVRNLFLRNHRLPKAGAAHSKHV